MNEDEFLYPVPKMRLDRLEFPFENIKIQHLVREEILIKYSDKLKGFINLINDLKQYDIKTLVEIGCYQGESTTIFAYHLSNTKIYAVDSFKSNYHIGKMVEVQFNFDRRISKFPNIFKIKKDSVTASKDFLDKSIDVVYLDGDHSYNSVINDINSWLPKIKDGGIICGHDYNLDSVKTAIGTLFKCDIKLYEDTSWLIKL